MATEDEKVPEEVEEILPRGVRGEASRDFISLFSDFNESVARID